MLNYIKAELWKVSRRGSFYVVTGTLLFLAHLFGFTFGGNGFLHLAGGVCNTMMTGFFAAPALAQMVDNGFQETVRNEVSFGLSREQVYLGKLFSSILIGLALSAVLIGGVLLSGWVFLPHGDILQELVVLAVLLFCLLASLPIWCGMLGLCHMLATMIRSESLWVCLYFGAFFMGQPAAAGVVTALARHTFGNAELIQAIFVPWTLLMSDHLSGSLTPGYLLLCWAVGLGWLAATTAAGLLVLRRKDIR